MEQNWTAANIGLPVFPGQLAGISAMLLPWQSTLFIGVGARGVYSSSNSGLSWSTSNKGLIATTINALATMGSKIFSGSSPSSYPSPIIGVGMNVSSDAGQNWSEINNSFLNSQTTTLAIAVKDTTLYAGCDGKVLFSNDSGSTWADRSTALPANATIQTIFYKRAERFLLGSNGATGKIYRSLNNGNNWTLTSSGLPTSFSLSKITAMSAIANTVFVGTFGEGIFKSTNNGNTWFAANTGLSSLGIGKLATDGTNLFAGTNLDFSVSTDTGFSWNAFGTGSSQIGGVTSLAISGTKIFAGTFDGLFFSNDNGFTWSPAGLSKTILSLAISANKDTLYAGTQYEGIWKNGLLNFLSAKELGQNPTISIFPNPSNGQFSIGLESNLNLPAELSVIKLFGSNNIE